MSNTLTIRNLDEGVKRRLRLRAASHERSMEAEAREILAASLAGTSPLAGDESDAIERRRRIEAVVGIWKGEMGDRTTDQIMRELRGDD